jgi:hypothetical protein
MRVARATEDPDPTTIPYANRRKTIGAADRRGPTPNMRNRNRHRPAKIAMLPPEMAIT